MRTDFSIILVCINRIKWKSKNKNIFWSVPFCITVLVGVKAAQPHRPHPRFFFGGGGKRRKKTGEKKKPGKKRGKKLNTCLLFSWRPSSFGLINIWLKFQEYRMASTIFLTIESLVKLKASNMWKHVWDCALSTADRRPSYNKYIVITSKKMFRGTHHNYSFIIKTNLCCFGAILMRLN